MAVTFNTFAGNGTTGPFSFSFEYIDETDVKVSIDGVTQATTAYTFPTASTIQFVSLTPTSSQTIRIFRETDVDDLKATFFAGSSIRSQDLNDNFEQNNFAVQEIKNQFVTQANGSFSTNVDMNSNRITELADPVDAQDAVTKQYLEDNYFDDGTETITSGESWPDNDTTIATTAAVDNRVDSKIDTAIEGDVLIDSTGLTKSATGGQVTLGIGANSVDLDRIKNSDIVTSSESNPNNDTTIATTAKIDDMIDAAITGDIAAGDGLSVTNDGDGTITIGIPANSVDLDRLKNDDVITLAEQDAGPTTNDDSIFTSSAAAKRFDTLVQTGTPSGSYQIGKTWLQNDDDQTLKIWNGSAWLDVASGGSFRTQDKVIYVDKTGGDDTKTGHRISGPKATIKAAINDINADVDTSIKTAGSGYTNGTYSNVPLTGGTTGSGLTATITVAGGVVSSVTNVANSTLQEYQIGDILSAADSNLGGGGGSGFELEVTGNGDGMTVIVSAGTYQEIAPIQIKRRNVSIIGMALRSCLVHPTVATQGDHADGNNALFELNSGSFVQNLTLTGMQAGSSGTNTLDSDLPQRQGWNFAFYNNAFITKSPYIQNCTNFSDSQIDNSDLRSHRPRGGSAGDLTNAPTGGGMLIDGNVPKTTSPLRSMVADSYTHVGLNGPGILVTNNGYAQCTSSYAFFNKYHIKALNGGQANLAASTTDFGEKALVADGKSTAAIFSGQVNGAAADGDITFDVDNISAGTSWFGDDTKPASNMLVTVNSVTYPILSSTVITGGHRVTISRPNPSNKSQNQGLNGAVADDAAVQFFLRSQIASSGHTMEYVGSGMDYDALPENGGVPDETKQITELNNGKVWTATTDHNGKFRIGGNQSDAPVFQVDQQLGFVTIPSGSIAFNLQSDTTPQLGGNLDVNGKTITSTSNANVVLDPNGTGSVDVSSSKIINVTDPGAAQDAATKNYVDTQVGAISTDVVSDTSPQLGGDLDVQAREINTSTTNGNIKLNPNGTGVVEIKGDGSSNDGTLQLNCSNNSHGVKIKSPPHSASASYTLTLPNDDGNANQVLKTDGSGGLSWVDQTSGTTNLSYTAGTRVIASSTGTDATLPLATTSDAGLLSSADKIKLNGLSQSSTSANNTSVTTVDNGINNGYVDIIADNSLQARFGSGVSDFSTHVRLSNQKEVRYYETTANGSNYLAFKAPASLGGDVTFTLPDGDGSADQVLKTDGSGTLAWADQSGGGGATGGGTDKVFQENLLIVDNDYTVGTNIGGSASVGSGASCVGPITVNAGKTLTVRANSRLVVL